MIEKTIFVTIAGSHAHGTGELRVRRQNAAKLIALINGALTFDQVVGRAAQLQAQMREATSRCALPDDVDYTFVDSLVVSLIGSSF